MFRSGLATMFATMFATGLAATFSGMPLWAEVSIRAPDRARLETADATFGTALRAALAEGAPADVAVLVEALAGAPGPVAPAGDWNCRVLKLGGLLPLTVYTDFRCRIVVVEPGIWELEKLTGSQRVAGRIHQEDGAATFLGVGYVTGGPAADYQGLPPLDQTPVEPGQTTANVGFFEQMGPDRARLLFPQPLLESEFDILYLTR